MANPEQNLNDLLRARWSYHGARADELEPLPPEFEATLRSLDGRLGDAARRIEIPSGLEDRVHEASAALLPRRIIRPATVATPGFRPRRLLAFRSLSGRLAMAASLGLAFVLASAMLSGPPAGPAVDDLALDAGWLTVEPFEDMDRAVAHLLDTRSLTIADLTGEIDSIVAASEM